MTELNTKRNEIRRTIERHAECSHCLSGGVDSSLLLKKRLMF